MYYCGIDLGGTKIAAGIVDENGTVIMKDSVPTGRTREPEEIINDMCALITKLMKDAGISKDDIHSIGIGTPGIPDRKNGIIVYSCNINLNNVNIRNEIQKHINVPVYLENDANCAAIAESVAGAAKTAEDSVTITIGTGIGGGVIISNRILTGFNGAGGELGHIVLELDGEQCTCGRKGCWEVFSSATALIRQTRRAAKANPHSKIVGLVAGDLDKIDAKTAFDAARLGDETAVRVIDRYIDNLADGLANIINIFQPEVIVIGGGVSKEGENLLEPLRQKMKGRTYGSSWIQNTRIVAAQMGNDAGIVGAALISRA